MIKSVIACFIEDEYHTLFLQPNQEFGTDNGNGWKGVIRWLQYHNSDLEKYLSEITPSIDLLIIQMDADVARCEKEIYCSSVTVECDGQTIEDFLNCSIIKNKRCPQSLPPNSVCDGTPTERVSFLKQFLNSILVAHAGIHYVVTIPCDATDAWIVAAFEEEMDCLEQINDPWNIISHNKYYHGIRIHGNKKSKKPYERLIDSVCEKWDFVKHKCPQAFQFEMDCKTELSSILSPVQ